MPLGYALQQREGFSRTDGWRHPPSHKQIDATLTGDESNTVLMRRLGVDYLPLQLVKHRKRRPFYFNIMVCGESGLGKTTFLNTLFELDLLDVSQKSIVEQTVAIEPHVYELMEEDVRLVLTLVDTPGFGDQLNREPGIQPVIDYIDEQYQLFHHQESQAAFRRNIRDTRIHALLYFINPTGHKLKELDISFLSQLATKTSVIPIIGKADTMTADERLEFKKSVAAEMAKYDIRVFPDLSFEDFEDNQELTKYVPFTVIGSTSVHQVGDKQVRGRKYRWGVAEVDNPNHCDFIYLRELLVRLHMQDLIEICHNTHYFNYRTAALRSQGRQDKVLPSDEQFAQEYSSYRQQMQEEMMRREEDMRQQFFARVKEKEAELRTQEEALLRRERELMDDIEDRRRLLESEEREFDALVAYKQFV